MDSEVLTVAERELIKKSEEDKRLRDRINSLSIEQRLHIKQIVMYHDIPFTKNKNGIFLCMSGLTKNCLREMIGIINKYEEINKIMDSYEEKYDWKENLK